MTNRKKPLPGAIAGYLSRDSIAATMRQCGTLVRRALGRVRQSARFHWPFVIVLSLYIVASATLVAIIPPPQTPHDINATAPDEGAHYLFNVQHIVEHNSLPVSGKDDIIAYQACVPHHVGVAPCVYSYTIYPGPNYVISALFVKIFHHLGNVIPSVNAARLTSLLSGIVFAVCSYWAVYSIIRRRLLAMLLVASAIFIPQFIFVSSYTNLDAHSAAISAILGLCLVKFMQQPRDKRWQIALAIALCGLLPVSKYNYFPLGLGSLILIGHTMIRERFTKDELKRLAVYGIGSFVLLASFWYIRNLALYHDLLGQSFMLKTMAQHAVLGKPYPTDWNGLNILIQRDFFTTLFQSFFFALGLMHFYLGANSYDFILALLLAAIAVMLYNLTQPVISFRQHKKLLMAAGVYALTCLGTLLIVAINSLHYDFQPQGRYMYPVLIPSLLLIAYAIRQDKRNHVIPYMLMIGTIYLVIEAIGVVVKAYMPLTF